DLVQLVSRKHDIRQYQPIKQTMYYQSKTGSLMYGAYGLAAGPLHYLATRLVIGDKADNIKGIHGVGDKTAFTILEPARDAEIENLGGIINYIEHSAKQKLPFHMVKKPKRTQKLAQLIYDDLQLGKDSIIRRNEKIMTLTPDFI